MDQMLTDKFSDISEQEENESSDNTMDNKSVEDDILKRTRDSKLSKQRQTNNS